MTETEPEVLRYLREIERKQDVILERLEMSRPVLDGIQRDIRMTAAILVAEFSAIHRWMGGINARTEDAP
jgi:hypothetical protein